MTQSQSIRASQLLLSYDFPPMGGGIARWMGELAKRYPPGSLLVSTGRVPDSDGFDRQFPNQVDRLSIASNKLRSLSGMLHWSRRAAILARALPVEFIWCGNVKPASYPARWAKERTGTPYGIFLHGGDLLILARQAQLSLPKRRIARALLGSASVLVSNSTYTMSLCRALLEELEIGNADQVTRIPLGADPAVFRPGIDQTEVRRRYGLEPGRWLLSVARLARHKGIDTGIQVLAHLAPDFPDLRYAVAGSGDELINLKGLARSLGVVDRVRFLSNVPDDDLPGLYNCAEIYLGLSRTLDQHVEGFGISMVEASACGIPVLAGRAGGIPDAVRDGETGLLVDSEDRAHVLAVLRTLLNDQELRSRLGGGGRRAVEMFYNWDRVAMAVSQLGHEHGRSLQAGPAA